MCSLPIVLYWNKHVFTLQVFGKLAHVARVINKKNGYVKANQL